MPGFVIITILTKDRVLVQSVDSENMTMSAAVWFCTYLCFWYSFNLCFKTSCSPLVNN